MKSWRQSQEERLIRWNESWGFHIDERARLVHQIALRDGYLVQVAVLPAVAIYEWLVLGQTWPLWAALGTIAASVLLLLLRRLQLGGWRWGTLDERASYLMRQSFRWAYLVVVLGTAAC